MNCDYEGFEIESFEVGRGLWHARFRRADHEPVIIDGVLLPALNVGFALARPGDCGSGRKSSNRSSE
jgi:hypothetical protein